MSNATRKNLRAKLFEEQEGICYLCGGEMDRKYIPGTISWATIDHVVPLVRGGADTENNMRLAHRGCNTWKRNALLSELPDLGASVNG